MKEQIREVLVENMASHHEHLREGYQMLKFTSFFSRLFSVVVAKPNLSQPVVDAEGYNRYYNGELTPYDFPQIIGGIMLSPSTTPEMVEGAQARGAAFTANIPRDVSTNGAGISIFEMTAERNYDNYDAMRQLEMPLLLHVQSRFNVNLTAKELELFFSAVRMIMRNFPKLKISIEHANLKALIDFVYETSGLTCGIAPHYGIYTEGDAYDPVGRICRPAIFCQPPYGDEEDRAAVIYAMANPYFKGKRKSRYAPDNASHFVSAKLGDPASGCFSGFVGPCEVLRILEEIGRLGVAQQFLRYDEEFFGVPLKNPGRETVFIKEEWTPPIIAQCDDNGGEGVYLLRGGERIPWRIK